MMMSEKRFSLAEDSNGLLSIFDNEDKENEPLIYGAEFGTEKIVDLLNEQQATIKQLESDKAIAEDYANIFEMENVKLRKKCGESDGENAKLRIENKELQEEIKLLKPVNIEQYEQIVQLQEENEQLKKSEKINMEYAEQIVEENHKIRIAKNDLRIENKKLKDELMKSIK